MGKEANSEEVKMSFLYRLIALALSIWLGGWVAMLLLGQLNWQAYGEFGDAFGVVNALFSALAFAGLIFTALLQRKELHLQRKELALTRSELSGQKEQMEKQNETWSRQTFERTFFEIISMFNEIVAGLRTGKDVRGKGCFRNFYEIIKQKIRHDADSMTAIVDETTVGRIYFELFPALPQDLSNYFRVLYNILKFVKQSTIPNKKDYTNLVRALLTQDELCFIFYNCVSPLGRGKLRPLLEEFSILKHLNPTLLVNSDHVGFFEWSAFEKSIFIDPEEWCAASTRLKLDDSDD